MNKNIVLILILCISLLVPMGYAEYLHTGDDQYLQGEGIFNEGINYNSVGRTVSNPKQIPLVADLNNNGTNEIIVMDGNTIRLFSAPTLGVISSKNIGTSGPHSNMWIQDVDSDGKKEITIASGISKEITILQWDGSSFTIEKQHNLSTLTALDGNFNETLIACRNDNQCVISYLNSSVPAGVGALFASHFNYSDEPTLSTFIRQDTSPSTLMCFPNIKAMSVFDYNSDGSEDFIVDILDNAGGSTDQLYLHWLSLTDGIITNEQSASKVTDDKVTTLVPSSCDAGRHGLFFSPPTTFQALGGGDAQTFVALQTQTNNFKIFSYDADSSLIDEFPTIFDGDSTLISNVIKGNFFPDTGDNDFCAIGYEETDQLLDIVCASLLTGEKNGILAGTKSYEINVTLAFNISQALNGVTHVIGHASDHDDEQFACLDTTCSPKNLDEIVSAYGIYKIRFENAICDVVGSCEAEEVFANPASQSGALLSHDVQQTGEDDLLLLTDTNIFYYDSLFSDQPSAIDLASIKINPCIDIGAWQINTSLSLSFKVNDQDPLLKDNVGARAILYADSPNAHTQHSDNMVASGSTFTFNDLKINKTTSNGILRLISNDSGSKLTDQEDIQFSVSEFGIEFGECTTSGITTPAAPSNTTSAGYVAEAGTTGLKDATNSLSDTTNLGGSTLWLIAMAIIAFGIITGTGVASVKALGKVDGTAMLGGLIGALLVDGIIFIVGAVNGVFSPGVVFMVFILLIVVVVVISSRFIFGSADSSR